MNYAVYKTDTGEVVQWGHAPDQIHFDLVAVPSGCSIVEVDHVSEAAHYFPAGVKTDRPALTSVASWDKLTVVADLADSCNLTGLPNPTSVDTYFNGVKASTTLVTSGQFTLTPGRSGDWTVEAVSFPYRPYQVTIQATKGQGELDDDMRRSLMRQITYLESKQLRSTRELAIGRGNPSEARARLEALDDQIAALRAQLP